MPGKPIAGRYELIGEISAGGMGTVWRGYDSVLDREVAVKLIRPDMLASPKVAEEFAKRFRREARVTARIRHHGVPQVYDAVLDKSFDRLYLVMELIHGTSLRAYINPDDPLPIAWAVAMGAQISTVLSHAHAVPVVHRDLKPDNVLVAPDGTVKVLDFGIAAILRTDITKLTPAGQPIGTSKYMSPEQIRGAQITPHSDLYALGCILYELLCGRPVFDGHSDYQLWQQHTSASPRPPHELRDGIPADLEYLVLELLKKSPEHRPQDAYAVYERLLPFLPAPGSSLPMVEGQLLNVPDPTHMFRRPNAPHPRPTPAPPAVTAATAVDPNVFPATGLRDAIRTAVEQSDALLEEERFAQAADVLQAVITPAAEVMGAESRRVLQLRMRRAAILVLSGDPRRALAEFNALAAAYVRAEGTASPNALECRRQAAHCRAELGQATTALKQFREVLDQVRKNEGDASPTALDLRRNIGVLLIAEGDAEAAFDVLEPLHEDLCLLNGPDHEDTQEIADLLARLRL
ncbi:Serine/threonine protein kinase [Thermomonospora echinospora]|uniref:non-specific serine/threonine protein kinase n=1 Tax=Thermomonospora echinospora TaxID=1992 RepID=A0A1H5YP76_9ACTN|nr:serine/threonine-protein kinase [Thermomonospora echinospora]SEG25919.1 Serine/threonine protein kinase [Thermomonospora echinospora]